MDERTITTRDEHHRARLSVPESLRGGQTLNRLQAESPSAAYGHPGAIWR